MVDTNEAKAQDNTVARLSAELERRDRQRIIVEKWLDAATNGQRSIGAVVAISGKKVPDIEVIEV